MKLSDFRQPASIAEAFDILKELGDKAMPIAGGTSLHFLTKTGDRTAVDITKLGFNGIDKKDDHVLIGATTVVADLMAMKELPLAKVAKTLSTNQIRHMSTIGGNIVAVFPWADFPVALLALDGSAAICGNSDRDVDFDEYFKGQPARLFEAGDLLKSVKVNNLKTGEGFGYHKEVRTAAGFSMATAAAKVKVANGAIESVRIAVGACTGIPRRLTELEDALKGVKADWKEINTVVAEQTKDRKWKSTEAQGSEYTAHLAQTVITDAIFEGCQNTVKEA